MRLDKVVFSPSFPGHSVMVCAKIVEQGRQTRMSPALGEIVFTPKPQERFPRA